MKTIINIYKEKDLICDCCLNEKSTMKVSIKNYSVCIGDNCINKLKTTTGLICLQDFPDNQRKKAMYYERK